MRKYFDMNKVFSVLVSLTLTCAITSVSGAAVVTADCSEKVVLGDPGVVSCKINSGTPDFNWFRANNTNSIISCFSDKACTSNQKSLYETETNYTGNKQQFTILKISEDDFKVYWICVDSLDPHVALSSQKCMLTPKPPPPPPCVTPALLSGFLVAVAFVILIVIIHFCWKGHMETLSYIVLGGVAVVVSVALGVGTHFCCLAGWSGGAQAGLNIGISLVSKVINVLIVRFPLWNR